MARSTLFAWILLLATTATSSNTSITPSAEWFPEFLQATIVSENMNTNGIDMAVWEIRSNKTTEETINYYRNLWKHHKTFMRYNTTQWQVIGFVVDQSFISVQLLPNQLDSFGFLSISTYPNRPVQLSTAREELPPGTEIISETNAVDGPHKSRTIGFTNNSPLETNAAFFRNHFSQRGWIEDSVPINKAGNITLLFRKGPDNTTISLSKQATKTGGVAIIVEH